MTETEIIGLLGEPEQKLDELSRQYVYYLGRAGLGGDDRLLRLDFFNKLESPIYNGCPDVLSLFP